MCGGFRDVEEELMITVVEVCDDNNVYVYGVMHVLARGREGGEGAGARRGRGESKRGEGEKEREHKGKSEEREGES